jgi:hypothetical protein
MWFPGGPGRCPTWRYAFGRDRASGPAEADAVVARAVRAGANLPRARRPLPRALTSRGRARARVGAARLGTSAEAARTVRLRPSIASAPAAPSATLCSREPGRLPSVLLLPRRWAVSRKPRAPGSHFSRRRPTRKACAPVRPGLGDTPSFPLDLWRSGQLSRFGGRTTANGRPIAASPFDRPGLGRARRSSCKPGNTCSPRALQRSERDGGAGQAPSRVGSGR